LAMIDCLSGGRLISGFARGIPREYQVHNVPLADSRARFEEAYDIITRAWSEEVFSYEGKFWSYKDVALWPRPVQQPHPPVWIPVTGSKESIEFAAKVGAVITPGLRPGGLQEDIVRYFAKCLASHGRKITPNHLSIGINSYIADSKAQAVKENAPYFLYFNRTLFSHGNFTETSIGRSQGYISPQSVDYVRPENLREVEHARADFRNMTLDDVGRMAERLAWGTPQEVTERIIATVDRTGANSIQVMMNAGAMPQEMFLEQVRRFARDVLPALQAHEVKRVPVAEEAAA
jgi:alkanesulfonate monooxygenase SsuD/methylene tetrahydromethanopterin reductase-like flavin-dependent oxidoreductase (luciferase family)